MGKRKMELKGIEDKSSRQVTFSKRLNGLMKKARELSILCDVEVALLIFSSHGKLYEFSGANRHFNGSELEHLGVADLVKLETRLHDGLSQIRSTKMQQMVEYVMILKKKDDKPWIKFRYGFADLLYCYFETGTDTEGRKLAPKETDCCNKKRQSPIIVIEELGERYASQTCCLLQVGRSDVESNGILLLPITVKLCNLCVS